MVAFLCVKNTLGLSPDWLILAATLKSVKCAWPASSSRMLSGLMSRWTMFLVRRKSKAHPISAQMKQIASSLNLHSPFRWYLMAKKTQSETQTAGPQSPFKSYLTSPPSKGSKTMKRSSASWKEIHLNFSKRHSLLFPAFFRVFFLSFAETNTTCIFYIKART